MKRFILILVLIPLLQGCADVRYNARLQEIESAYQNKTISTAEYLSLKNQADQTHETRKMGAATAYMATRR